MTPPTSTPVVVDLDSKATLRAGINNLLPPELLALAFSFLVADAVDAITFKSPEGPDVAELRKRFSQHPLWNASLVCRAWHTLIKNTPRFWAFLAIGIMPLAAPGSDRTTTATSSQRKGRSKGIEILLERSGGLPLTIMMCPKNIQDFDSVSRAIHKHLDRLETLSLIISEPPRPFGHHPMPERTTIHQFLALLAGPMPNLKLLSVAMCLKPFVYGIAGRLMGVREGVDAPQLATLSCHTHLIFPESPTQLTSLSLIKVDFDQSGWRSVELPNLIDLRIEDCNPGTILSTFGTPSLRRLVVASWSTPRNSVQLPRYDSLQELQWLDMGEDPLFALFCRLCPNLKRYFNYIEEDNIKTNVRLAEQAFGEEFNPPMILRVFDEVVLGSPNSHRGWPVLEEVSLDRASCDHVATLIEAKPSIKRVRILRDPVLYYSGENREGEMDKLAMLRAKVEMAFGVEPWGSGPHRNETPREGEVTV